MRELAGRLTALDPDASESLKVITFFDSLVASGAGVESVVRSTVMISGAAAGAHLWDRTIRIESDGTRSTITDQADWPSSQFSDGIRVWIERAGAPHANDAMILERAALALTIIEGRRQPDTSAVDTLLHPQSTPAERAVAARRLRLSDGTVRVIATAADHVIPDAPTAVIATPQGLVRATIGIAPATGPAGTALAPDVSAVPQAWGDARIALQLADARHAVVDADAWGALIGLARALDATASPHPDVIALRQLDDRSLAMLDVLVEHDSLRAAASALAMHHSSLQSRHETWVRRLDYDPISPLGRTRYIAARMLQRLTAP